MKEFCMRGRDGVDRVLLGVMAGLLALWAGLSPGYGAEPVVIRQAEEFFPDSPGTKWRYRGRIVEGLVNQIADKTFVNVSHVKGEEIVDGLKLVVFHDSNPGNQGPSDSYYLRDAAGIRYYGSKPGTELERQLIPYQIIRFPIVIPSSFQQLNRKHLKLGHDLDQDGQDEMVDVQAVVTVMSQETVTVPFGTFHEAIRMEASMTMLVHLSGVDRVVKGTDTMTVWFARGVGLIKYVEHQVIPTSGLDTERIIEVTEELEEATLGNETASRHGRKPAT